MSDYLMYDGQLTSDYGIYISGVSTFVRAQRDRSYQSVPGRSGDLVYDEGRYPNVKIQYPAFIRRKFDGKYCDFLNFLNSHASYARLEDTYDPDCFRLALPNGAMAPKTGPQNWSGKFTLEFTCKPQRYLKSGELPVAFTSDGSIYNPELMPARPLIRVYGSGVLGLGSGTLTIAAHGYAYMDVDCDIMDAHYGAVNLNSYLTLSGNEYPTLVAGANNLTLGSGITRVEITPRWWRL